MKNEERSLLFLVFHPSSFRLHPLLRPVLIDFAPQEGHTFAQLIHAVDTVFDANPAVEADAGESSEDLVVVVHAAADGPVPESLGVAEAVFLVAQVVDRTFGQVAIAGV